MTVSFDVNFPAGEAGMDSREAQVYQHLIMLKVAKIVFQEDLTMILFIMTGSAPSHDQMRYSIRRLTHYTSMAGAGGPPKGVPNIQENAEKKYR